MGTWGYNAWESDGAADWFADLHDMTGLRDHVVATLRRGVKHEGAQGVRAAAHMVRIMCKCYRWPVHEAERDMRLALQALGEVRAVYAGDLAQSSKRKSRWQKRKSKQLRKVIRKVDREIGRLRKRVAWYEKRERERMMRLDDASDSPAQGSED